MAHFGDFPAIRSSRTLEYAAVRFSQQSPNCTHLKKSLTRN